MTGTTGLSGRQSAAAVTSAVGNTFRIRTRWTSSSGSRQRSSSTFVRGTDDRALAAALTGAGIDHTAADGGYLTQAPADQISRVATAAGVRLTELRAAEQTGLEDMFLRLTADHSRENAKDAT
jgi:hypothetical protein